MADRLLAAADDYRLLLAERMPPYTARADAVVELFARAYAGSGPSARPSVSALPIPD